MKKHLLIAASDFLFAVGTANAQIVVRIGPPPPRPVETVPPPPHEGYVWVPGYHRWDGHGYVWVHGEYRRPRTPVPSGFPASGVRSAAVTSGTRVAGANQLPIQENASC